MTIEEIIDRPAPPRIDTGRLADGGGGNRINTRKSYDVPGAATGTIEKLHSLQRKRKGQNQ